MTAKTGRVLLAAVILLGVFWLSPLPAAQAQTGANPIFCQRQIGGFLGLPTWYKYLNPRIESGPDGTLTCVINFAFTPAAIGGILLAVFEILLRLAGMVAVVFVIWGGIKMQTSLGNPDQLAGARVTLINALVGLAIVISATVVVNFIGRNLDVM